MNAKLLSLIFILTLSASSCAQDKKNKGKNYSHEVVVDKLIIPWGFVFLPDNAMLITEKQGILYHFKNGIKTEIQGLPDIKVLGQGGLMDIVLHPNYENTNWVYFSYASASDKNTGANTTIMRAKLKGNTLVEKEILYKAIPDSNQAVHFGSRLAFDNEGYLYFSIGDRGNRDTNPQDITRDCGKIYRIHDNGNIPEDNPFVNHPKAKKAIYSYGHRNPQGMVLHPESGEIWTHEHGPRGGDEINIIHSGKNYGWPKVSYGINYDGSTFTKHTTLPGIEEPIHHWTPSIAPSGMAFVTGNTYPDWKDNLLVGSLKFQYLNRCVLKNNTVIQEEKLLEGLGRVRTVKQGPDGYIYVGIENLGIVKIIPKK